MKNPTKGSLKAIRLLAFILLLFPIKIFANGNDFHATIRLYFNEGISGDSIYMETNSFIPQNNVLHKKITVKTTLNNKGFTLIKLELPSKYAYFFLSRDFDVQLNKNIPLIDNYLIKAGDDITIFVKYDYAHPTRILPAFDRKRLRYSLSFKGKGSEKLSSYETWKLGINIPDSIRRVPFLKKDGSYNSDNSDIKVFQLRFNNAIGHLHNLLDSQATSICKADFVGDFMLNLGRRYNLDPNFKNLNKKNSTSTLKTHNDIRKCMYSLSLGLSTFAKSFSKTYSKGCFEFELANYFLDHDESDITNEFFSLLTKNYDGLVRDALIYELLSKSLEDAPKPDSVLSVAMKAITNPAYKTGLNELRTRIKGVTAYNFSLLDVTGKRFSLADFKGKIVLIDFYFRGCHACAGFYRDILEPLEEYYEKNKEVVFVAISTDDKMTWAKSLTSNLYTSNGLDNVINLYTEGLGDNHPVVKNYNIQGYPCPILIDKNGKIIEYNLPTNNKDYITQIINNALTN